MPLASLNWDKPNWANLIQHPAEPQKHRLELPASLNAKIYFPNAVSRSCRGAACDSLETTLNLQQRVARCLPPPFIPGPKEQPAPGSIPFPISNMGGVGGGQDPPHVGVIVTPTPGYLLRLQNRVTRAEPGDKNPSELLSV